VPEDQEWRNDLQTVLYVVLGRLPTWPMDFAYKAHLLGNTTLALSTAVLHRIWFICVPYRFAPICHELTRSVKTYLSPIMWLYFLAPPLFGLLAEQFLGRGLDCRH
jgi:hypothetical protein